MIDGVDVQFEYIGDGGEFWGGTQASFLLVPEEGPRREVSVVLTDAAAAALAEARGAEDTQDFREELAVSMGQASIEEGLRQGRRIPPTLFITAEMATALAA